MSAWCPAWRTRQRDRVCRRYWLSRTRSSIGLAWWFGICWSRRAGKPVASSHLSWRTQHKNGIPSARVGVDGWRWSWTWRERTREREPSDSRARWQRRWGVTRWTPPIRDIATARRLTVAGVRNYSAGGLGFLLALRRLSPPSRKISEFSTKRSAIAVAMVVL